MRQTNKTNFKIVLNKFYNVVYYLKTDYSLMIILPAFLKRKQQQMTDLDRKYANRKHLWAKNIL